MFKGINAIEFGKRFPNNESCLRFLEEKKWGNGYRCARCGWDRHVKGKTSFYRRCQRCAYDESVTANTLFHDMHLPIVKAFHMLFRIATKKKGMSTVELAGEVGVQQRTAWLFKRKMQAAMLVLDKSRTTFEELVMSGNATSGSSSSDVQSRPSAKKSTKLASSSYKTQGEMIIPDKISIRAMGFRGKPVYAMLFRIWLRGIHHKCSRGLFYAYCNEFWFRIHNRKRRQLIFDSALNNIILTSPHPYAVLKVSSA